METSFFAPLLLGSCFLGFLFIGMLYVLFGPVGIFYVFFEPLRPLGTWVFDEIIDFFNRLFK